MTPNGMTITHKLEAHGSGTLKASQLAALAGLVPDEARIESKNESHRSESAWTWTATWDHSTELANAAQPPQLMQPVSVLDLLGRTEPTLPNGAPRCPAWSDARHTRFGFRAQAQCRMEQGHSTLRNGAGHDFPKADEQ